MTDASTRHMRLPDRDYYALVNAVTSRVSADAHRREVVDQDGLRREFERILGPLYEQLEAAERAAVAGGEAIKWLTATYPKVMDRMPRALFRALHEADTPYPAKRGKA